VRFPFSGAENYAALQNIQPDNRVTVRAAALEFDFAARDSHAPSFLNCASLRSRYVTTMQATSLRLGLKWHLLTVI